MPWILLSRIGKYLHTWTFSGDKVPVQWAGGKGGDYTESTQGYGDGAGHHILQEQNTTPHFYLMETEFFKESSVIAKGAHKEYPCHGFPIRLCIL